LQIAYDMGKPRKIVTGANTDVYALKDRKIIKNAVNMTCGYHASVSASANEYIDIEEARDTMKYVAAIVKDYNISP
jgi:acetylornithine deacetylase/succinyl-diaminopimelate desuccinylase-like protein